MGLNYFELRRLAAASRQGAGFTSIATIGRQQVFLHPKQVRALSSEFDLQLPDQSTKWGAYGEPLLRELLAVEEILAIDASDYEGANLIHDLNEPIPAQLERRFDAVIDGGSLEHIFNFPTALANVMRMLRVGGRTVMVNPANNLCGHGFFQFSPELAYSALNEQTGFSLIDVLLLESRFPAVELTSRRRILRVTDPAAAGGRAMRMSNRPAMLYVEALKLRHEEAPFRHAPQQSDYLSNWRQSAGDGLGGANRPESNRRRAWLIRTIGRPIRNALYSNRFVSGIRQTYFASRFNRRIYTRVDR